MEKCMSSRIRHPYPGPNPMTYQLFDSGEVLNSLKPQFPLTLQMEMRKTLIGLLCKLSCAHNILNCV